MPQNSYLTPILLQTVSLITDTDHVMTVIKKVSREPINIEQLAIINMDNQTISIAMVRSLQSELSYAAFQGKKRHVVICNVDKSTPEAQNAVLKILEEPPLNTQFWLITQYPQHLLPTLISRCVEMNFTEKTEKNQDNQIDTVSKDLFTTIGTTSYRELIDVAEKYKEKTTAIEWTEMCLKYFHQTLQQEPTGKAISAIKVIIETRQHLAANVSPRQALENCLFRIKKLYA